MKKWLIAFRLRTLPLSLACVGMGSILAHMYGYFRWQVMLLSILTTICLQILSNLANDYGDSINGADNAERLGPKRAVQSGEISAAAMKRAVVVFVFLSLLSGTLLLLSSIALNFTFVFFFFLGIACIAAAIYYTMGSKPYGYAGLGDISVFLFFGITAVCGTFFLHSGKIFLELLYPSISCGLFSVGVLNVNNIRDIASDKTAGKLSIPVRIGRPRAVVYHWFLLLGGFAASILFVVIRYESLWQLLFILSLPFFIHNGIQVTKKKDAPSLDPYLKQLALSTLLFVLLFGLATYLSF